MAQFKERKTNAKFNLKDNKVKNIKLKDRLSIFKILPNKIMMKVHQNPLDKIQENSLFSGKLPMSQE